MDVTSSSHKNVDNLVCVTHLLNDLHHVHLQVDTDSRGGSRGGGTVKKIAPSGARREHFWGISCEKSRFYPKKSYFFQF